MTTLVCNFSDVLGTPVPNGIARVTSGEVRPGLLADTVIVPQVREQPLVDGTAVFPRVEPGDIVIHLIWKDQQASIRTLVPDQETVNLSDCIQYNYTIPSDIETARSLAISARESQNKARQYAEEAASAVTTAAAGAVAEVKESVAADKALIEGYKNDVAASVAEVNEVVSDASAAAVAAVQAELSEELARSEAAATKAEQHEAGAAAAAAAEVNKLKGAAPEAFDTLEEIAAELAANETERSALANSIAAKANKTHDHTIADVIGLEDALAAAGTAEHTHPQSEVDGLEDALAGKASADHKHTKADITDLETISFTATVNHLVKRTTSGNIIVPTTPISSTSAASKSYVDARTPEIQVVASPEQATSPGVLYVVEED